MPHLFVKLFIVIIFLLFTTHVIAQETNNSIIGKVVNETEEPISDATVLLIEKTDKVIFRTTTAAKGTFKLSAQLTGKYHVKVSHTGYQTYTSALFDSSIIDLGKIILSADAKVLNEVLVQSKQNPIEMDANSLIFNVSKTISAQGTNALEVLRKAPGVFVDNDNTISLNGKAGAMILLDGKQTYLSSKEIADLLKSMPSSNLKSIEIINNPSAKYDAAGTAGIINIRTVKSQVKGFNGNLTTGLIYGVTVKQSEDLSFNYRKNDFNIYGSYNHFIGNYKYLYGSNRLQNGENYISDTDDTDKRKKMGSRLGMDYNLNAKNTIGLLLTGNFIFGGGITDTHTELVSQQQNLDAINDYYHQNTQRYHINFNYKYEDTVGNILNIDADYGYYQKDAGNMQRNRYTDLQNQMLDENLYRTINGANIFLKAGKLDYITNLWKGKLETGVKFSTIKTDNNSRFFHVLATAEVLDDRRSNQFSFKEDISSGYVNYKKTIGKWNLQAGLRLEHTKALGALTYQSNGNSIGEDVKRNYTNLFPTFSVSVKPSAQHNFSLGYSRRIDRPAYQDLNPFVYLLDELSFWSGNPFLKPQLSHSINLLYAFKSATIIGLNYGYTNDFKAGITDTIDVNKIVMVPRNVGVQHNLSLTLTQMLNLTKWWDMTFNGTLYHLKNKITFDQYRNFNLAQTAGRLNLQQTFKLPYKLTGEIFSTYNSKRLVGANEVINPTSQVDLGLQRNFFKNKATLRFIVTDIYKGSKTNSTQNFDGFYFNNYAYYETRQIRLNFSYKFADGSLKGPRIRNSALESENGRIK